MSIRIEILDGTSPILDKIATISLGLALECLSISGDIVRKNARNRMRQSRTNWFARKSNGKILWYKHPSATKELGRRISMKSGSPVNPDSMSNMINSYLMEKSYTVVIGGSHPRTKPKRRENGEVKGYLPPLPPVSKATKAILHKLNTGQQSADYKNPHQQYKNPRYLGYHFMEKGYMDSKAAIIDVMTRRYETMFGRATNNIKAQARKVV